MPVASFCAAKSQDGQLLCIKIGRHVMYVGIQWNPDFSNTRLFETTDSSNQKSFPLIGFVSVEHGNFTADFSNARFFETPDISN